MKYTTIKYTTMKHTMMKHTTSNLLLALVVSLVGAALPLTINAAPGDIADTPLFLTNKAEPNIFFMVDDSGSMDFEMATDESELEGVGGTTGVLPVRLSEGGYWGYFYVTQVGDHAYTTIQKNGYAVPTQESVDAKNFSNYMTGIWRARNHVFNRMYYNPNETYKPWPGVDNAGVAFADAYTPSPPTWNTRTDPFLSNSSVVDLSATQSNISTRRPKANGEIILVEDDEGDFDTAPNQNPTDLPHEFSYLPARYWFWQDTISNNVVDPGDSKTLVEIKNNSGTCTGGLEATDVEQATGCMLRSYAAEMKNFANWWTYYRRREYAAKNALGEVVKSSNAVRMGVATINGGDASERKEMARMNADISTGNKRELANAIYSIQSKGGTELLNALRLSGNYFSGNSSTPFNSNDLALDNVTPQGASGPPAECSQNFTVLMTDGYYTDSTSGFGNVDLDNDSFTGDYKFGGNEVTQTFSFGGAPYADGYSNTLADIAMYYYERDLRSNTANKVPTRCGLDENPAQHMVTYTVAFGVNGSVNPNFLPLHPNRGYAEDCSATTEGAFSWPDPGTDTGKIDELIHAAYNGRGEYLDAADPNELSESLADTFESITSRLGSASAVSFNSVTLNNDTKVYKANFNSTQWSGELKSFSLGSLGNINTVPEWQAGLLLDARDLTTDAGDRPIVTYKTSNDTAVAFHWANLDTSQQNDLKIDSAGTAETTSGFPVANARLDYIRGHRGCEVGSSDDCATSKDLRTRNGRLGDIIHSRPAYNGFPIQRWPDQAPFGVTPENYTSYRAGTTAASAAFSSTKVADTRTPMLYAGANDGMLHAFNADTGAEVFAYIPSMVYSTASGKGLHALTEPAYNHEYYVDLTPILSEAYIDANGNGNDNWHSVLVGGLRGGGRGIYALDVTDPDAVIEATSLSAKETAVANMVMWEFTNADDPDMGYSFSEVAIAPFASDDEIEWYVVFGNGYNADTANSADGEAHLFLLKLEGPGADNTWTEGTDYYKISTGVGSTSDLNGLSTPVLIDLNRDSITDRVYAGDLHGNMWAFDVSGNPTTGANGAGAFKWASAYKGTGNAPVPLFYATDGNAGAGNKQPITKKPTIIRHQTVATVSGGSGNEPNLMVYFGTGQYIANTDLGDISKQSLYAVWDKGDKERTVHRTEPTNAANHLVKKTFGTPNATTRTGGIETVDYSLATTYGWYYDLPEEGERSTLSSNAKGGILFFSTITPSISPCDFGGSSWELGVKLEDGSSECGTFDSNGDGIIRCSGANDDGNSAGFKTINALANEDSFLNGGVAGNLGYTPGESISAGADGCPSQVVPPLTSCSIVTKPILQTNTDALGCKTYFWSCENYCPENKVPVTKTTTHSDDSTAQTTVCIDPSEGHTGRFSWRELPFKQ